MTPKEKRATARIPVNVRAVVRTLGDTPETNGQQPVEVVIIDACERGMRLHSAIAMKPGVAVKIEIDKAMFLDELCYCMSRNGDGFHIGVATEQCLTGLSGLQLLIQALTSQVKIVPDRHLSNLS